MNERYLVDISGKISGPHHTWELLKMRETGSLPDDTKVIYETEQWLAASLLKDCPTLLAKFESLSLAEKEPVSIHNSLIREEARLQTDQLRGIKWTLRGILFLIAIVVLFGLKITFGVG
jgi:hypothetical protein